MIYLFLGLLAVVGIMVSYNLGYKAGLSDGRRIIERINSLSEEN